MRALRPLAVLVDPVGAVPPAVEARAWVVPLLLAMVLSAAASAAIATRLDTARLVLPRLEAAGELARASEREIGEQVEQAQRVAIVAGVAKGLVGLPVLALLAAVGLWLMAWLVGGRAAFAELFTVICLALLPVAVAQGLTLASAINQSVIAPKAVSSLLPSSLEAVLSRAPDDGPASAPSMERPPAPQAPAWKPSARAALLGLVDFFHLWSALLLGLGFAAATRRARWQAVPLGLALYFLTVAAVTIGLPALAAGGGGPVFLFNIINEH